MSSCGGLASDGASPCEPTGRLTPQEVDRKLGQLEARAAQASDETLSSAVATGRRALAEWQDLAERRRELEGEYERLAEGESRALARLRDVLDLLDRFTSGGQAALSAPRRDAPGVLAVRMLGSFEVTIDGRVAHWQGQRAQSLMQFLAAHRHRHVSRDELIMALWPDADEDSGRHRLHQAAYELRGSLRAVDPDRKPVVCAGGGYGLDPAVPLWVDVEEFDALAEDTSRCLAAQRADEATELGRQALAHYRGDFLGQVTDADWATTERNRLRARFVQLSVHLGELVAGHGQPAAALALVDPVLSMEPWNEDATVIKMRCHARTGARSLAVAAYRSCAEALHSEFGVGPAARTARAYDEVRAAEPAGDRRGFTVARGRTAPRPPSPPAPGAAQLSR
jgi:DNA-binding SARP family transcriptional activator